MIGCGVQFLNNVPDPSSYLVGYFLVVDINNFPDNEVITNTIKII